MINVFMNTVNHNMTLYLIGVVPTEDAAAPDMADAHYSDPHLLKIELQNICPSNKNINTIGVTC